MTEKDDILLKRIANHLIMHASFMDDMGLYHGKMGVVLFFAHYGRYTGESLYDDFAGELLDEVFDEIHIGLPIDFENGFCGIGWAVEYLLNNEFIEGDSDDILSDIDKKVMERDLRKIFDVSLSTGLKGISCYINMRVNSSCKKMSTMPFDQIYLSEWQQASSFEETLDNKQTLSEIIDTLPKGEDIASWNLGLKNGCSGYGLNKLLQ